MDSASAKTNQRKDIKTGMTPFLRPSRKFCASSVRLFTMLRTSSDPLSGNILLKSANRRSLSASIGGSDCFGSYWFIMQRMYSESLIVAKSEPSGGYSLYLVAMSTIRAHLPVILMFQRI